HWLGSLSEPCTPSCGRGAPYPAPRPIQVVAHPPLAARTLLRFILGTPSWPGQEKTLGGQSSPIRGRNRTPGARAFLRSSSRAIGGLQGKFPRRLSGQYWETMGKFTRGTAGQRGQWRQFI